MLFKVHAGSTYNKWSVKSFLFNIVIYFFDRIYFDFCYFELLACVSSYQICVTILYIKSKLF